MPPRGDNNPVELAAVVSPQNRRTLHRNDALQNSHLPAELSTSQAMTSTQESPDYFGAFETAQISKGSVWDAQRREIEMAEQKEAEKIRQQCQEKGVGFAGDNYQSHSSGNYGTAVRPETIQSGPEHQIEETMLVSPTEAVVLPRPTKGHQLEYQPSDYAAEIFRDSRLYVTALPAPTKSNISDDITYGSYSGSHKTKELTESPPRRLELGFWMRLKRALLCQ